MTSTLPGQQLLLDVLRDRRKHNAAGWVFSQHADDLTPDLRDLVATRFVFGLSGDAAAAGLSWLGVDPSRQNVDLLESWAARREPDQRGTSAGRAPECLLRDASGRNGHIQVSEAEIERFRVGFESNPTRIPVPGQPDAPLEITAQ